MARKNNNIKTKELLFVGTLIFCLVLVLSIYLFINYKNMDKYVFGTNEILNNEMFAVLIEDNDGIYKEADINNLTNEHFYNNELSGCIDKSGNKVEDALSYENGKVIVKTNRTVECYLYFDKYKEAELDINLVYENNTLTGTITLGENILSKYCVNNSIDVTNCEWKELNGNTIKEEINTPGTYYVHVLDNKNFVSHKDIVIK